MPCSSAFKRVEEPPEIEAPPVPTNNNTNWIIIDWKKDYKPYFKKVMPLDLVKLKNNLTPRFNEITSSEKIDIPPPESKKNGFTVVFE